MKAQWQPTLPPFPLDLPFNRSSSAWQNHSEKKTRKSEQRCSCNTLQTPDNLPCPDTPQTSRLRMPVQTIKKQIIYLFLKQVPVWIPPDNVPRRFSNLSLLEQMSSRDPFHFIRSFPTVLLWSSDMISLLHKLFAADFAAYILSVVKPWSKPEAICMYQDREIHSWTVIRRVFNISSKYRVETSFWKICFQGTYSF